MLRDIQTSWTLLLFHSLRVIILTDIDSNRIMALNILVGGLLTTFRERGASGGNATIHSRSQPNRECLGVNETVLENIC